MMRRSILLFFCASFLVSCERVQPLEPAPVSNPVHPGWETYIDIRDTLQDSGKALGYDTLMYTYHAMQKTQHEIPHMDQLLLSLINKRSRNPRIDQMILISAARVIGGSKFPVPDAHGIFQEILARDDRLTAWVITFVAQAIGDYDVIMPNGDKLVDLLELKLAMVLSSSEPKKEDFGRHFLPPPKGQYINAYITNIETMHMRMSERRHYFLLITNGHAEVDIEKALRRLQSKEMPNKKEHPLALMKHLFQNPDQIVK